MTREQRNQRLDDYEAAAAHALEVVLKELQQYDPKCEHIVASEVDQGENIYTLATVTLTIDIEFSAKPSPFEAAFEIGYELGKAQQAAAKLREKF